MGKMKRDDESLMEGRGETRCGQIKSRGNECRSQEGVEEGNEAFMLRKKCPWKVGGMVAEWDVKLRQGG